MHPHENDELVWIKAARSYLGVGEIKGSRHNSQILKWWQDIGSPFKDDETPWCGAFVGGVLAECDQKIVANGAMAKSWLNLPVVLGRAAYGCVVVFNRPPNPASGHVGFVVGRDRDHNLMVLGGNQGDKVSIKPFGVERVAGYRWPGIWPREDRFTLPVLRSDGRLSQNEV